MSESSARHVVAIFGGACAGSTAAEVLATHGVEVVVFEQNVRPYGKIEDGLPRWHREQRSMEYRKIDARLDRPGVHLVPSTRLGRDLDFADVVTWGWSAVLLANGAWRDRTLEVPDADRWVGHGLAYQNPFIYWFNHLPEAAYDGPRFEVPPGAICIGGGLASIDVIKVIQLELYGRALRERGVHVDMYELEHRGIPTVCRDHGIEDPHQLGVADGWLTYRRRVEDMPIAPLPDGATAEQRAKIEAVRRRMLAKAQDKFLFHMRPQVVPKALVIEEGHVAGVRFVETTQQGGRLVEIPDHEIELHSSLVVSSIGSLPELIPGIVSKGTYYDYADWDTGAYAPIPGVFGVGNVVTGRGNIKASEYHSRDVAKFLIEHYLGVQDGGDGVRTVDGLAAPSEAAGAESARAVLAHVQGKPPLDPDTADRLVARARARQQVVGCTAGYAPWLERVTPPDME
jgi:ferredoxin/flavodoxin---NADP+ reductase